MHIHTKEPCEGPVVADFDYHQTSKFAAGSKIRQFAPGEGFLMFICMYVCMYE